MLIAVIADTHGKFPAPVAKELKRADEVWHLGDFCDQTTLDAVKAVGRPFFGVLGNNDWRLNLPRRLVLERFRKTFLLYTFLLRASEEPTSCFMAIPMSRAMKPSA